MTGDGAAVGAALSAAVLAGLAAVTMLVRSDVVEGRPPGIAGVEAPDVEPEPEPVGYD
ncbi:hypothetical protein ABZ714_30860 [Streptomyces sp. NPDC006798]|uniref:hypothetical protein n=1 Tax=Streptomyces sp. NPDC006798 TaxID=3155462 RepID=UPI0033F72854